MAPPVSGGTILAACVPAQVGLVEATGVTARERVESGAAALRRAREQLAHEPERRAPTSCGAGAGRPGAAAHRAGAGDDELPVGALAALIGRKVPATSQQLRELGVVHRRRHGSAGYYCPADGPVADAVRTVLRPSTGSAERPA